MSEVGESIEILKGPHGPRLETDEVFVTVPDPVVSGCVLVGMKKARFAALVYTSVHELGEDWEEVDWDKAAVYLERWEAGLDGEALMF